MTLTVTLARDARVHLAGVLSRFVSWQESALVRLVTTDRALGIYADAPMGVLVFVAVPLAEPVPAPIDRAVSAHRLRDILGDVVSPMAAPGVFAVPLPDARDTPPALAVLPVKSGWIGAEKATAAEVASHLERALADFQQQDEALTNADESIRRHLAEEWWDTPSWGGLPLKALQAARLLGMLAHPGARIESATRAGWKRMITPAGQVFVAPPALYQGIPLSVVK